MGCMFANPLPQANDSHLTPMQPAWQLKIDSAPWFTPELLSLVGFLLVGQLFTAALTADEADNQARTVAVPARAQGADE